MARKKKTRKASSSRSKKSVKSTKVTQHLVPEGFWAQVMALAVFLAAILLIIAMFGIGGPLPTGIYNASRYVFGWAVFVFPFVLMYMAAQIFMAEANHISFKVYTGCIVFMWSVANFLQLFVHGARADDAASLYIGGGAVGASGNRMILQIITSKPAAGMLLLALAMVSLLYVFKIPLKAVFTTFFDLFRREETADNSELTDDEDEMHDNKSHKLKLNTNVPIETATAPRRSSMRNSIEQTDDTKDALTTTSDPEWNLPSEDLLSNKQHKANPGDVQQNAAIIKNTLAEFRINVEMEEANIGPRVTQFTLRPPAGVKLGKIASLDNNLALNLEAKSIRIEAPIPGKKAVGVEVPNKEAAVVNLRDILASKPWQASKSSLSFAVGQNIAGEPIIGNIDTMPHLLIAGQTGSGKSVMINALLTSLLYRNSPADLKLILVDPKQVELTPYNHIPHLLTPVIVKPDKCISALKWAVNEMERRYGLLAEHGKRNIAGYNQANKEDHMPYIVIVVDELSDLMMVAARDVEALIARIAQKARAVGIHLVLATQRPSVDVITGLIKANIPSRIAFTTASQVDSRTIIDQVGAEKLLGKGDLLMTTADNPKPTRIQGVFVDDAEVMKVTDFIKMQRPPEYDDEIVSQPVQINGRGSMMTDGGGSGVDALYDEAVQLAIDSGKASTSMLQTRLQIGYGRAARIITAMQDSRVIGPSRGAKGHEVLVSSVDDLGSGADDFDEHKVEDF